eukprot:scaffold96351_cov55-Phaeocystis_antarctica.AAC.5
MRITYFPLSRRSPREPAHLELAHAHVVTLADSQVSGDPHMPVWRRRIGALRPQRRLRQAQPTSPSHEPIPKNAATPTAAKTKTRQPTTMPTMAPVPVVVT